MKKKKFRLSLLALFIASFFVSIAAITYINQDHPTSTFTIVEKASNVNPVTINAEIDELKDSINLEYNNLTKTSAEDPLVTTAGVQVQKNNPFYGKDIYVDPESSAKKQSLDWKLNRTLDADKMDIIANNPTAKWLVSNSLSETENDLRGYLNKSFSVAKAPLIVLYNIPVRDCNSYSAGGAPSDSSYIEWINTVVKTIGDNKTFVVLEPDALASLDCLNDSQKESRIALIANAIKILKSKSNIYVYLDAGNATWIGSKEMALRLIRSNISIADGFSLNVSSYYPTAETIKYGEEISSLVNNKHFVIDTSRNGDKSSLSTEWCNSRNRAIGEFPTYETNHPLVDAYLWVKVPGESDGNCNGGPNAGVWWSDYALELVNNYIKLKDKKTPVVVADWDVISSKFEESPKVGKELIITNILKTNKMMNENVLVDIEIYNEKGSKVSQSFYDGQSFNKGIVKEYMVKWKPESKGKYIVKVGIFKNDWSKVHYWNDDSMTFEVKEDKVLGVTTDKTNNIEIWWPINNLEASGKQPFKAIVNNLSLESYNLYWQVDNGRLNLMDNNLADHPHKEILVDLGNWNWKNDKSYEVKFIAKDLSGNIFAEKVITLIPQN